MTLYRYYHRFRLPSILLLLLLSSSVVVIDVIVFVCAEVNDVVDDLTNSIYLLELYSIGMVAIGLVARSQ
jgi:hypothetical protein